MDVDRPTNPELVSDDFDDGEHKELDAILPTFSPAELDRTAPFVLSSVLLFSDGDPRNTRFVPEYLQIAGCRKLINDEPWLVDMLREGCKNGYKSIRLLKLLRPGLEASDVKEANEHSESGSLAVEKAWNEKYVGGAADALQAHVQEWYHKKCVYANCAIVQSSGMGKSRAVDEMSKSHFVIPVNLRGPKSTGYPPSDVPAYKYLIRGSEGQQRDAFIRSCSFLDALFVQTARVLENITEEPVAQGFRSYLNEGMRHRSHGPNRVAFYKEVANLAQSFHEKYSLCVPAGSSASDTTEQKLLAEDFPLRQPFEELCRALGRRQLPTDERPPKQRKLNTKSRSVEFPLVVAYDEIHTLTERKRDDDGRSWSCFGEMCRATRALGNKPFFALYLSTSGALFSITPAPEDDMSSRMLHEGNVMLPFCELGFDEFATYIDFAGSVKLSQVTTDEHLMSYGRPLWPLYYRAKERDRLIRFAASKLLGGTLSKGLTTEQQQFACLAQRIPIEFLSVPYASQMSNSEKQQVHSHLRVILKVDDSLETMVTTSPSEPVLSEAAYFLMSEKEAFDPPNALQDILDGFAVNKDKLGELIVALLFTMARDRAVGPSGGSGRPPDNQRWCSLTDLLTSLFRTPSSTSDDHVDVTTSCGWRFTAENSEQFESPLADTFKDSKVYFTHFIKVHQHALVQVDFLMRLMVRGAAMLCANGQSGVDGIIPFLLEGDEIKPDNIGVIMFQVKDDDTNYSHNPKTRLFEAMDPRSLGVTSPSANVPVIRIVFALAAKTPRLALVDHPSTVSKTKESYASYDFWVAGLSPKLLMPVEDSPSAWKSILESSHGWKKVYADHGKARAKLRKSMNPGTAVEEDFWVNWCNVPSPSE